MKNKITEQIYTKIFDGMDHEIKFSDLPLQTILNDDIIDIRREDAYHSENESYDAYTQLVILRERDETDEEYDERITKSQKITKELKEKRYQNYLKLKKEFEK